ncbi:MAG: Xaa-Pro aminopeptidase, partial [Uliginosibacterium sp.]|nr:Xaa-Pro aminopeptidase [Uliginosibacterium sp.]
MIIIPTAPERVRNRDSDPPVSLGGYFHYLGFTEQDGVLVMVVGQKISQHPVLPA